MKEDFGRKATRRSSVEEEGSHHTMHRGVPVGSLDIWKGGLESIDMIVRHEKNPHFN